MSSEIRSNDDGSYNSGEGETEDVDAIEPADEVDAQLNEYDESSDMDNQEESDDSDDNDDDDAPVSSLSSRTKLGQYVPHKTAEGGVARGKKLRKKLDKGMQLAQARESAARNRAAVEAAREKGERIPRSAAQKLVLPYRATRRIMKLDKDVGTVQVEAAVVATYAAELFVKKIARESYKHAKQRGGRNIIKYEDVAEVRAANKSLNFLEILLP